MKKIEGAHGWGPRNDAGEKLLEMCVRNSLVIGNTWFEKRKSHKITRYGWDGHQESIIDYILVDTSLHHKLIDIKVIPSESLGSDHRLLVAQMRFNKLKEIRHLRERKIKSWRLKQEEKQQQYQDIIKQVPKTEVSTVESEWKL